MKKDLLLIILLFILSCSNHISLDHLYPSDDLIIENLDDWGKENYKKMINEFKNNPLSYGDIVFLGNSITQGGNDWSERLNYPNIKNRGIGGDVTDGVLSRIDEIGYFKPKAVFLLIGINDLWNNGSPNKPSAEYIGNIHHSIKSHPKLNQTIENAMTLTSYYQTGAIMNSNVFIFQPASFGTHPEPIFVSICPDT